MDSRLIQSDEAIARSTSIRPHARAQGDLVAETTHSRGSADRLSLSRRDFLVGAACATAACGTGGLWAARSAVAQMAPKGTAPRDKKALIAITLDLEMSRNFPKWEDTHWDYEKGNLNDAAKAYTVEACRRVKERGGVVHVFVVGRVLEQENVDWLKGIASDGHSIGNHTYDHVYVLAKDAGVVQFRFARAPWLMQGKPLHEVIRENIAITSRALKQRVGVEANGFRTPGGFADGLSGREDIQRMLLDLGFKWVSAKYPAFEGMRDLYGTNVSPSDEVYRNIVAAQAHAQPFVYPTGLIEVPMSPISDIGAFRGGRWKLEHFLQAVRLGVNWAIENAAAYDFLSHPSCLGVVDPKFKAIDLICDLVEQANDRAAIVDLQTIASRATTQPNSGKS